MWTAFLQGAFYLTRIIFCVPVLSVRVHVTKTVSSRRVQIGPRRTRNVRKKTSRFTSLPLAFTARKSDRVTLLLRELQLHCIPDRIQFQLRISDGTRTILHYDADGLRRLPPSGLLTLVARTTRPSTLNVLLILAVKSSSNSPSLSSFCKKLKPTLLNPTPVAAGTLLIALWLSLHRLVTSNNV